MRVQIPPRPLKLVANTHLVSGWAPVRNPTGRFHKISYLEAEQLIRNQVLDQLLPLLWFGIVERAITLLRTLETDLIKNQARLDELITYFQRQQPYIPCYAVRKGTVHFAWFLLYKFNWQFG